MSENLDLNGSRRMGEDHPGPVQEKAVVACGQRGGLWRPSEFRSMK